MRALLASGLVAPDLDPAGVAGFLMYGAPQDPLTVHRDIRSFPSGTRQWFGVDKDASRVVPEPTRRFWRFPESDPGYSEPRAVGDIRAVLERVVGNHLAADVPSGFFPRLLQFLRANSRAETGL